MSGKFTATDDVNINGHHLRGWDHMEDIPQNGAVVGDAIVWNGEQYAPAPVEGGTCDGFSHTLLSDIGVNTHVQLDDHLAAHNIHIDWTNATEDLLTAGTGTFTGYVNINYQSPDEVPTLRMISLGILPPIVGRWLTDAGSIQAETPAPGPFTAGQFKCDIGFEVLDQMVCAKNLYFNQQGTYTVPQLFFTPDTDPTPAIMMFDSLIGVAGEFRFSHPVQTNKLKTYDTGQIDVENDIHVDVIDEFTLNAGVTIDGLLIKDGGIAPYDAHIADLTNPHNVTKTQVGLSAVSNDAQLKRSSNDFASFVQRTPVNADVFLFEDASGTGAKAWNNLDTMPVSLPVQAELDLKQDELTAGTNIDAADLTADTVSVVDAPTHAGICTADKFVVAETDQATKTNIHSSFAVAQAGVDTNTYMGVKSDVTMTASAGSLGLESIRAFDSEIVLVNGTPAFHGANVHVIRSTFNAGNLALGVNLQPVYFQFSNPATTQGFAEGYISADITGGASGTIIAARTRAKGSGTASLIGYSGYATAVGGSGHTGSIVGVQGYAVMTSGANHSYVAALDSLVVGSSSTPADVTMGLRVQKHALIKGGSLFVSDNISDASPASLSPTHVDPLNNSGELYVKQDAEIDGELFADGNESSSIAAISASATAGVATYIVADATSGAITVTLPAASGLTGRKYTVKKTDSSLNAVTVDGNGTETIDGALTYVIVSQYLAVKIISDGSNWHVV